MEEDDEPESKKGKKDPALPKGTRSAYTFFNEEVSQPQRLPA